MKKSVLVGVLAGMTIGSATMAQDIYFEGFTNAPAVKVSNNSNSDYAGTGQSDGNHINANEWLYRAGNGDVSHNAGAVDIDIAHNVYYLIDLSTLAHDPGAETNFFLSFDVANLSGDVSLFAFAGSGLDYSGTGEGHVFFRTHGNPCLFQPKNGATGKQVLDGATTTIQSDGLFQVAITTTNTGHAGDYLFIGFANSGESLTIDNLRLEIPAEFPTLTVQVPQGGAMEQAGEPGVIRISRAGNMIGDLNVLYTLSGTADGSDYAESYSGTVTIPDGSLSVDLHFTPVDDGVSEGYETIDLQLTADAAYTLGDISSGSVVISDVSFDTSTLALTIDPYGGVSLTRDGVEISTADSKGWSIYNWVTDTRIPLTSVTSIGSSELQLTSSDGRYEVDVEITANERYMKFELLRVSNTFGGELDDDWPGHRVEFDIRTVAQDDGWKLNTILLNPMSELNTRNPYKNDNGAYFSWPYPQWAQTTDRPQPQGQIAVFGFVSDEEHDDILAEIWAVEPSLPRPDRANKPRWEKADVLAWLDRWEAEVGKPWRTLAADPQGTYSNLYALADHAYDGGLNAIYLSQHSWQGDNIGDFNSKLFPSGRADGTAWRAYCDARGISLHFHGFSHLIRKVDPDYGRGVVHDELARSAGGILLDDVPAEAKGYTFRVQPDWDYYIGMKEGMLPFYDINELDPPRDYNGGRGGTFPVAYEGLSSLISLNKNLYKYTAVVTNGVWQITLDDDTWARPSTTPLVEHKAGDAIDFLLASANGGYYLPDSRSQLLVDQAVGYAQVLNDAQTGAGYDGAAWTEDFGSWGLRRFSQEVVERMDHPAGGGSSFGIYFFGHFEYQFKRVQKITALGGSNLPVHLTGSAMLSSNIDTASRAASTGAASKDIGLRAIHGGLSVQLIDSHGLWTDFGTMLTTWRNIKPQLSAAQLADITDVSDGYHIASETAGQWLLTKTQAMRRPGVDGDWNVQPERPPVAPRQFCKPNGEALYALNNPFGSQTPVVELHVMADMTSNHVDNLSLMPADAGEIINPADAEQTVGYDSGKLTVAYDNTGSSQEYVYYTRDDSVGHWLQSTDMSGSRGVAIR